MNLQESIARAHEQNEKTLASQIAAPKVELESGELVLVRRFSDFCKARGVPFLPAAPSTVAVFLRSENQGGADYNQIFATAQAIERLHDRASLSNPVATHIVRSEIGRLYEINPPRSWAKVHHSLWACLPVETRHVIENYADLASKAVRKAQNEAAELRHKLKSFEQKGTTENEASEKV